MEFHRIRYFLEAARQKHFSRAARVCNVSQPSLSQQIRKLEDELGEQLFRRSRDAVALTEFGRSFLPHAQAIMAEVESAREFADQTREGVRGVVRFGAIPTIAPYLMPGVFERVRAEYPEVQFDLVEETTDALVDALRSGRIDFAVWSPPTRIDQDTEQLALARDELLVTLPEAHRLSSRGAVDLAELAGESVVLLQESHCLSAQTAGWCKAAGLQADVVIRSSQIDTLLGMVELGLGFSLTPAMARAHHRHRRVTHHAVAPERLYRDVRMVWMRRHVPSRSHQRIIRCLAED